MLTFELCAGNNPDGPFSFSVFPKDIISIYSECWLFCPCILCTEISLDSLTLLLLLQDADAGITYTCNFAFLTVCRWLCFFNHKLNFFPSLLVKALNRNTIPYTQSEYVYLIPVNLYTHGTFHSVVFVCLFGICQSFMISLCWQKWIKLMRSTSKYNVLYCSHRNIMSKIFGDYDLVVYLLLSLHLF